MAGPTTSYQDSSTGLQEPIKGTSGAAHTLNGGPGGTANTAITSFPHTLATFTGTASGTIYNMPSGRCTFQVSSAASHTGTSTVDIRVSNDNVSFIVLGTVSVTGNSDSDGFASDAPWAYVRAVCTAHGDSANDVSVTMGV